MTTIVLADDHHVVRHGLRALLASEPDFEIIGETADGLETVRLVESLQPDILLLDLMMGGINGLEVTRQVTKRVPGTSVIILTMYGNQGYVVEALRGGAKAYVLKELTSEELIRAIHEVAVGRHYLSSSLSERVIEGYIRKPEAAGLDAYDTLTPREREVLSLLTKGSTNKEIAQELFISEKTVKSHLNRIFRKLNVTRRLQAILYAIKEGM